MLEKAISGVYQPHSGWSQREYDIAFLAKALGGSRMLYVLQSAEAYPSARTLQRRRPIPELIVPSGRPTLADFNANFTTMLGKIGRPAGAYLKIGLQLMLDGVNLEEALRYDHAQQQILGLCREHAHLAPSAPRHHIQIFDDITQLSDALYTHKACHHGKDGTVLALAPVTGRENYYPTPVLLTPSCKAETGEELASWISQFLEAYHKHPDGEKKHGPITCIATDGESSFRSMRYRLGLSKEIDPESPLGLKLHKLPGFNTACGQNGLITSSDPKHVIKRFASMVRSTRGVQIGDTIIKREDFRHVLIDMAELSEKQVDALLNPADKQNVPSAVNLLKHLLDGSGRQPSRPDPSFHNTRRKINFLMKILSYFVLPFSSPDMCLSDQLKYLAAYQHLVTAMYRKHHSSFMNTALYADSQSIVKSIFHTATRLQLISPDIEYFILFDGQDRLEGVFSNVRTQDHARNFDPLQLAHKLSVGAEVNAIFERNPDLYQGHMRRNLQGSRAGDHLNPASWKGNVRVGDVVIYDIYMLGRAEADNLLRQYSFDLDNYVVHWDAIFRNKCVDHLRPDGTYIGSRAQDVDDEDDDSDQLVGSLLGNQTTPISTAPNLDATQDTSEVSDNSDSDAQDVIPLLLNPDPAIQLKKGYIMTEYSTKPRHIDSLVAEYLVSERARKSTQRTLRVRDITIDESSRRMSALNNSSGHPDTSDIVKHGDLGAFLVCLPGSVCLAVGEVISFRQKSNKRDLMDVSIQDLSTESGANSVSVMVRILGLDSISRNDGNSNFTWHWTRKFIRLNASVGNEAVETLKAYSIYVPGHQLFPIAADFEQVDNEIVWAIQNEDLDNIFKARWDTLDHDNDDTLAASIEVLPKVESLISGLPYQQCDTGPSYARSALPSLLLAKKLPRKHKIQCKVCGTADISLFKMREHVGCHILRASRVRDIDLAWHPEDAEISATVSGFHIKNR